MNFWDNIFSFSQKESEGEALYFKLFELFVVSFVIHFAWDWGIYIQQISEVVLPLGIAEYIDISFMFDHNISLINAALMTLFAGFGFFRIFSRYSYLIAFALFHLHYAARFSLGEISHGSNFIGMSLLALALALLLFRNPTTYRRFALGFVIFFVGLGYTSAGISKLIGTGLTWPSGEHLWLWIAEREVDVMSGSGVFSPNLIQELALEHHFLATLTLIFGLLTELFGFLIWFKKFRPYIATALIVMHLGVYISMNIMFSAYILELLVIGYPWIYLLNKNFNLEQNYFARLSYQFR